MKVQILREAGYEEAMLGLSLSYERDPAGMPAVMERLFDKGGGHNKFLESMVVWLDVVAPRHFWQQFDTYRTGMTKQSGSTMHTLTRRPLGQEDFDRPLPPETLLRLNALVAEKQLEELKNELPEGFLQRRILCTNYMTLRNIVAQRKTHRNPAWRVFCTELLRQVARPEFFKDLA
ncbi:MAG: hypothetical protein WC708_04390 [Lentisphaeria bacterium]